MSRTIIWHAMCLAAAMLAATPALADGTVTLSVDSSLDGLVVQPGDAIDWTATFTVSQGDNLGAALVLVDFAQSKLNPGKFFIPPATAVPAGMEGFARPDGISNPGAGGYLGTQLGTDCEANLYQIGGAQNTTGVAGTNMGQDTTVDSGVGQGATPQELASGVFNAPSDRGVYVFEIKNAAANVLFAIGTPPGTPSAVRQAATQYNPASFFIIVCPGDIDGDGQVDFSDLSALLAAYNTCIGDPGYDPAADLNDDGCVDFADLSIVMANYNTTCQ